MSDVNPVAHDPKPLKRSSRRATRTLVLSALMLAATRCSVQRQRRPYSIRSRDSLAMAAASLARAKRKERSELVVLLDASSPTASSPAQ